MGPLLPPAQSAPPRAQAGGRGSTDEVRCTRQPAARARSAPDSRDGSGAVWAAPAAHAILEHLEAAAPDEAPRAAGAVRVLPGIAGDIARVHVAEAGGTADLRGAVQRRG